MSIQNSLKRVIAAHRAQPVSDSDAEHAELMVRIFRGERIPAVILQEGETFDRYRICKPVSDSGIAPSGAFGQIYRVEEVDGRRSWALKVLRHRQAKKPDALAAFQREGIVLQALEGPGIPLFSRQGCVEGAHFLVQEWIEGETFECRLRRDRARGVAVTRWVLDPLCRVVNGIHATGYVHRDLAPCNIMVRTTGEIVLIDFGLTHPIGETLSEGEGYGNAFYLSPEQARREQAHPADDQFALGALAYELVTGQNPLVQLIDPRSSLPTQLQAKNAIAARRARFRPIHTFPSGVMVPEGFAEAIDRALALHRRDRFESVEVFRHELLRTADLPTPRKRDALRRAVKAAARFGLGL